MATLDRSRRAKSTPKRAASEKLQPVADAALGSVRETLKEQGLPAGGTSPSSRRAPRTRSPRRISRDCGCSA